MKLLHSIGSKINLIFGLAILVFTINACSNRTKAKEADKIKRPLRSDSLKLRGPKAEKRKQFVSIKSVSYSDMKVKIEVFGRVNAFNKFDVVSEVPGKIIASDVTLKEGVKFRKGQKLVQIDSKEADYALKSRKSSYINRLAQVLPDIKIDFPDRYNEWKGHFENIDIDKSLPEMPKLFTPQENTFFASQNISGEYYSLKSEQERLNKYTYRAPFDGQIVSVMMEEGMVTTMGSRIIKILSNENKEVVFPVLKKELNMISVGNRVSLGDEQSQKSWNGLIVRIGGQIDPSTQSVNVFAKIDNASDLLDGSYVKANIAGSSLKDVFAISRNALLTDRKVLLVVENTLKYFSPEIIYMDNDLIYLRGFSEGVLVVDEPILNAVEGMEVEIKQ
jgi:multidrug efflux pump subunit AcrA (membrane-fusion protein)